MTDKEKYPYYDELKEGLAAIKRATEKINEESRVQEMEVRKLDLADRVEDWKVSFLKILKMIFTE